MELTEFEGMPPLQHFCYNGNAGSASVLTFDASLSPAVTTVSSLVFRLGPKNNPPTGLADRLGDFPDPPICNANGEKFFRTDKKAVDLSGSSDAFGSDFVQSSALESSVVNLQRFDHILSFDDLMQARFLFSSKLGQHATEYTCFQPFVKHFGNDLTVYAYLPLGRHSMAHFVVKEKASGHCKVLSLSLKLFESVGHLNHWSFFVKELDEAEEEDATTNFQTAKFIFTNLYLSEDGALNLFYAEENFSLPRKVYCVCSECFAETHMSQLCGGYFCHASCSFDHLNATAYQIAIGKVRRSHEESHERAKDYHFLEERMASSMELLQIPPKSITSSCVRGEFFETFTVQVNEHIFDAKIDFGKVIDLYERSIPGASDAMAYSPLLDPCGSMYFLKKDGVLVRHSDHFARGQSRVYGRIVPKNAENVKLFLSTDNTVLCYWTVGRKHYTTNLSTFLANSILPQQPSSQDEKA